MMNDNAGGLHRTARTLIAEIERTKPEWFSEWADFALKLLGPRPDEKLGSRAHENWNCVALGMAMAFDYLSAMWGEEETDQPQEESAVVEAQPVADSTPEVTLTTSQDFNIGQSNVKPPTFAVLGPDGEPLIEGYRGS